MSVLNIDSKILFIQVPKTAGTSMRQGPFIGGRGGHQNFAYFETFLSRACIGLNLSDFFSFGFVRNPWDRLVSLYSHSHEGQEGFGEFVLWLEDIGLDTQNVQFGSPRYHYLPQWFYLADKDGEIAVDFVGRFERLEEDWSFVCHKVGQEFELSHLRKGYPHRPYREYYTEETWAIVHALYEEDVRRFKYDDEFQSN